MRIILDEQDFKLVDCLTGQSASALNTSINPDLILLDLNLPDMQGMNVLENIRGVSDVPIIIMSARAEDHDMTEALNRGANDYVIKPFSSEVFLARINAALRSAATREAGSARLVNGLLCIDLVRHQVFLDDKLLGFTPKEYNLLNYFMIHRGKMLTHQQILKAVWGDAHSDDTQYLRVFVGQIREKIEKNPSVPAIIVTEPGVGYRMEMALTTGVHQQGLLMFP